ncbi:unnamed protein product [Clonostachys rhizophaga]|uniref:Uncharacterized protein n=1 Tax=Clonostachys rhizophaga TaxID=160324 RepID=A0A9N9YCE9_9HYPO|nr:unnamed protein product [Clonostachys rhizophaga]
MGLLDLLGVGLNLASQLGNSCPAQAGASGACSSVHVRPSMETTSEIDALGALPFKQKLSILHQSLVTARSLVEDQGPTVSVPESQLHDVLNKIKAMEDQINQLLASKSAETEVPSSNLADNRSDDLNPVSESPDRKTSAVPAQQPSEIAEGVSNDDSPQQSSPPSSSFKLSTESVSNSPTNENIGPTSPSTEFYISTSPGSEAGSLPEQNKAVNLAGIFKESSEESNNMEEFETTEITSTVRITTTTTITKTVAQSIQLSNVAPSASNVAVAIPAENRESLYPTEAHAVAQLQEVSSTKSSVPRSRAARTDTKTSASPHATSRQPMEGGDTYLSLIKPPADIVSRAPAASPVSAVSKYTIGLDKSNGIGAVTPSGFRTITLPANNDTIPNGN